MTSILTARCGDTIRHIPTRTVAQVAFVTRTPSRVVLRGPMDALLDPADCEIWHKANDGWHYHAVRQWHDGDPTDWRRRVVMFLYRHTMENPPSERRWADDGRETKPT